MQPNKQNDEEEDGKDEDQKPMEPLDIYAAIQDLIGNQITTAIEEE